MKVRIWLMGVLPVLAVLGTLAGLGYVKYRGIRQAMAAASMMTEPVETVRMVAVETVPFQRFLTAVGTVSALQHLVLSTETAGKVVEVGFDSGQLVEKGQLLLRLDASTEAAELRSAEAMAELAGLTLERLTQAMADDARSHHELDRAAAEREQALGRTEQLRAMIAKKEIRAAFKGHVGMRNVHPGQYLAEGARITTLQGVADTVHVDFSLPQTAAASLAPGAAVKVIVGDREVPAAIVAADAMVDPQTRNARLRADLPTNGLPLMPGMFLDVRVPLGTPTTVVAAPPTAIRRAPFGDHVFVMEPDAANPGRFRARQRFVKLGGATPQGMVTVVEGLKPGEVIAEEGSFKLREGAAVRPPEAQASAGH